MDTITSPAAGSTGSPGSAVGGTSLEPDRVLLPTPWCVVREQERGYLLYNPRSDELHLLPPTAYHAYRLCDGLRTVAEVAVELARGCNVPAAETAAPTARFLAGLVERGLLEVQP